MSLDRPPVGRDHAACVGLMAPAELGFAALPLLGCEQQRIHHDRDEQCAERQADEPVFGHRYDGQIVGISEILPEQILSVAAVVSIDEGLPMLRPGSPKERCRCRELAGEHDQDRGAQADYERDCE